MSAKKAEAKAIRPDKLGKHTVTFDCPQPYHDAVARLAAKEGRLWNGQLLWLMMEAIRARGIHVLEPELAVEAARAGKSGLVEEDVAPASTDSRH